MERKLPDNFAIISGLAILAVFFLGKTVFDNLFYAAFMHWLSERYGVQEAQVIAGLSLVLAPLAAIILIVIGVTWYLRREVLKLHDPSEDGTEARGNLRLLLAQHNQTAALREHTEELHRQRKSQEEPKLVDIGVVDQIYRETRSIKTTDGRDTKLHESAFYLVVNNNSVDGSTMKNVQAEIVGYETPVVAQVRDFSTDRVDLKHGQAAYFLIGRTVGTDFSGNFVGDTMYAPDRLRRYAHTIASSRKPTFEVWSFDNVYRYGLNDDREKVTWELDIVISADDKKSKRVAMKVTPTDAIPIKYAEGE
jgi:hypothetical protein